MTIMPLQFPSSAYYWHLAWEIVEGYGDIYLSKTYLRTSLANPGQVPRTEY